MQKRVKEARSDAPRKQRRKDATAEESSQGYDLENIYKLTTKIMQEDKNIYNKQDNEEDTNEPVDCLLPEPKSVAAMMKQVFADEFPHIDINTVFVK